MMKRFASTLNRHSYDCRHAVIFTAILLIALWQLPAHAQPEAYNHPELIWEYYESTHFQVYFHQGTERTAREVLRIAEDIYEPITGIYDYEPDGKIHFVIRDHDDYSNGGAYYYDNKILIWSKPMDWTMRGTHNWLRNVVTHEFTHMIQLGAARKLSRWLPAVYFQWIDYEEEKRPDVLYGYPNILASYPLPMTIIPPWFAEGCSQSQKLGMGYDHWDSHRDMILRMRALEDNLLSYTELGYYGKTSYNAEGVYDHGYSIVQYIIQRWGEEKLRDLSHTMKGPFAFSFDQAIRKHLGMSGKELHEQWSNHLKERYTSLTASIKQHEVKGEPVADVGFANLNPVWSPDGSKFAYTSNGEGDYYMHSRIYVYDVASGKSMLVPKGGLSYLSWSPDGRFLFYTRQFGMTSNNNHFDDLGAWDFEEERELRLTDGRRASYIDASPDGQKICFVVTADGTQNLWIADLNENWWEGKSRNRISNELALTHFNNGEQIYTPRWSPDGKQILLAWSRERDREIILLDVESRVLQTITDSPADDRDPAWDGNGRFYFASDRTGIFNIYRYDFIDSTTSAVTNVVGGAFMPTVSQTGVLVYADFESSGYKIARIDDIESIDPENMVYIPSYESTLPGVSYPTDLPPEAKSKHYKPVFDRTFIVPRLAFDFGTFKPGIYFYFQDILEQMSAFGGFAINGDGDYDLFALLDYRKMHPTLYLEAFNLVRHTEQEFEDYYKIVGEVGSGENAVPIFDQYAIKYHFNLIEVDAGVKLKFLDIIDLRVGGILSRYRTTLHLDDGTAFGYTYFKGKAGEAKVTVDLRPPGRHQDICPSQGGFLQGRFTREYNDFIDGFEVNADKGTLQEVYTRYTYNKIEVVADRYLRSPLSSSHGIALTADGGFLDQNDVDDFFYLYAGGFDGMKGYSFYSLGGTRKAILRGAYCFPLVREAATHLGIVDLDKIYLQVYGDIGNAWEGEFKQDDLKRDIGISLKTQLYSFTTFPTAVTFDAAYGLDKFDVEINDETHTYGEEWRFYFTLLFNFNLRHNFSPNGIR